MNCTSPVCSISPEPHSRQPGCPGPMTGEEGLACVTRIAVVLGRMKKAKQERSFVALAPDEVDDLFYALRALATPIVKKDQPLP